MMTATVGIMTAMTLMLVSPEQRDRLLDQQHLVLRDVSWTSYERVLDELGDWTTRATDHHESIEIIEAAAFPTFSSSKKFAR